MRTEARRREGDARVSTSPGIRSTDLDDKVVGSGHALTDKLEDLEKGIEVALCGILTGIVRKTNREGKYWAAMKLEDRRGTVEAMVFANRYEESAAVR